MPPGFAEATVYRLLADPVRPNANDPPHLLGGLEFEFQGARAVLAAHQKMIACGGFTILKNDMSNITAPDPDLDL